MTKLIYISLFTVFLFGDIGANGVEAENVPRKQFVIEYHYTYGFDDINLKRLTLKDIEELL